MRGKWKNLKVAGAGQPFAADRRGFAPDGLGEN